MNASLKCNVCWKSLNSGGKFKSYKLSCLHVFCSACFRSAASSSSMMTDSPKCPACDSSSSGTTELEFSDELSPDLESKVVSAIYSNPLYWQNIVSEAHQLMIAQLFQEVQRGEFQSGARKLSAEQTLERLRDAEQSIESLQVKCEKKDTHIFELEHRIRERNRQIDQLEKVVRRRSSQYLSSKPPVPPPPTLPDTSSRHLQLHRQEQQQNRKQSYLLRENRRSNTNKNYLRNMTTISTGGNISHRAPRLTRTASRDYVVSTFQQQQQEAKHSAITTKKNPRMSNSSTFRPKTPGLDALLREQEALFSSQ